MTASLTAALLRQHVKAVHARHPRERIIGIHGKGGWSGPSTVDVYGVHAQVIRVVSPLHARDLISSHLDSDGLLVLISSFDEHELGADVVARMALRQLMTPDAWSLVLDAFKARDLDPRLLKHRWMATALLEALPQDGYPPVATGVLDSETAWALLLEGRLGLERARPDAVALLDWLGMPGNVEHYAALPDEMRAGAQHWLGEAAGSLGLRLLDAALITPASDLVPLGLVCTALFDEKSVPHQEARDAAIRLEPFTGGRSLSGRDGSAWAGAATALVRQRGQDERRVRAWCDRADTLLGELGAGSAAWHSALLPRGFEQRCERAAEAIDAALRRPDAGLPRRGPSEEALADAEAAIQLVRNHRQADGAGHRDRVERLTMALRLVRWQWLAETNVPGSLPLAARAYVDDTSFADWARSAIRGTDPSAQVSAVLGNVAAAARSLRERQEARFAELLSGWLDPASPGVLLTESVIAEVVAPAALAAPVLFLVVDGMSAAVFHELTSSILDEGWIPVARGDRHAPEAVVTPLPSLTEYCRTSLFSGILARGSADDERSAFAAHHLLLAHSRPLKPPVLFHKRDLGDSTTGLSPSVRADLESADRRVVGVVVNAVDDHLLKADQVRSRWTLPDVPLLRALLHAARDAGRLTILTADHGHVLESGTSLVAGGESDRWRAANTPAGAGERLFRGPRVMTGDHACIAATGESVRYRTKKNGYHGGATAQEMVVPIATFMPPNVTAEGWREVGLPRPAWWEPAVVTGSLMAAVSTPPPAAAPAPSRRRVTPLPPLLEIAEASPPAPSPPSPPSISTSVPVIDALLSSAVFGAQRAQHARFNLDEARVKAVLSYLLSRGGRATRPTIAAHLGLPPFRVAGQLTVLRTLLNVDAYPVLSIDEASDTVELNVDLLRAQFEL